MSPIVSIVLKKATQVSAYWEKKLRAQVLFPFQEGEEEATTKETKIDHQQASMSDTEEDESSCSELSWRPYAKFAKTKDCLSDEVHRHQTLRGTTGNC